MSLIFITHHDENIYNITKTQSELQKKSPKFISKFRESSGVSGGQGTSDKPRFGGKISKHHATMGLPEQEPPDPHNFLKKRTGKPSYTAKVPHKDSRGKVSHKAQTPLLKDLLEAAKLHAQKMDRHKDFVRDNVKTISHMKPKEPEHKIVIDRVGTTMYPEAQGLEPVYIKKPIFGKTPKYLVRFNKIKEKEYQMRKDLSGKQQPKCRYITRDEREQLLNGLKKNWEELQKQYQGLPILTDTIPKKVKKSKLEADLRQLEKDIVLMERHPYIYVYNDAEFST